MANPAIMTLTIGKDVLTSKQDIIWYLIAFSLQNPGETSSIMEDELLSFRKLNALYGRDASSFAAIYERELTNAILRYFPNDNIRVIVEVEFSKTDASYKLILSVIDDNNFVLNKGPVTVNGDDITIDFAIKQGV